MLALLVALLAGGCATPVTEYHEPPPLTASERTALNAQVFDRAWQLVDDKYFDARFRGVDWRAQCARYRPAAVKAQDDAELYRVLNDMCGELKESHLTALAPRRTHELETEHRAAIGIRWQLIDGKRVVMDVVPGGPADQAGIERGWLLVSRNGAPLREGETFVAHVGEAVTFGFLDLQNQPRTLTVTPQLITFDQLETRELAGGCVYLRFDKFDRDALAWLSDELKRHEAAPGVVLDLRLNGGGSTFALSMAIAEFFPRRVEEGRVIRRSGWEREARSFAWNSARYRGRVVILTGAATASAAEIFAHVLQYHGRATVIGQKTAGAVIYARNYALPGGGSLQVPVMDFVGLDGKRLEGRGVTPDIVEPPPTLADRRGDRDTALVAALDVLERPASGRMATVEPHKGVEAQAVTASPEALH
ncbi:MAG TPA: S41 family peptidase [Opitutus sp.]|nr:S41 family peptidase [Opitutus sp.]